MMTIDEAIKIAREKGSFQDGHLVVSDAGNKYILGDRGPELVGGYAIQIDKTTREVAFYKSPWICDGTIVYYEHEEDVPPQLTEEEKEQNIKEALAMFGIEE